jgi:hypothetical protein
MHQKGNMQPNTISYNYDHDNDGGTTPAVAVVLTRHQEELHKSVYRTAAHTEALPDTLTFMRTPAKRSGTFMGVQRVGVKRTRTRTVDTADGLASKAPQVDELSFSIPIGVSNADKLASYMEWVGWLSSSEGKAAMIALLNVSET